MSELRNCRECGKLFVGASPTCPECRAAEDALFDRVRGHLAEHPAASVQETCEATGITPGKLRHFVEEGRLVMAASAGLTCKVCGVPLTTGRLCEDCQEELRRAGERSAKAARKGGFYSRRMTGQ